MSDLFQSAGEGVRQPRCAVHRSRYSGFAWPEDLLSCLRCPFPTHRRRRKRSRCSDRFSGVGRRCIRGCWMRCVRFLRWISMGGSGGRTPLPIWTPAGRAGFLLYWRDRDHPNADPACRQQREASQMIHIPSILRHSHENPRQIHGIIAASIHDSETVLRLADSRRHGRCHAPCQLP